MPSLALIFAAAAAFSCSGLPACFLPPRSRAGRGLATAAMAAGSALGLAGLGLTLPPGGDGASLYARWSLPWGGFAAALDPLSSIFLVLVLVVPTLGSIYGLGYWRRAEHPRGGRRLGLAYGVLAGAMVLVLVARDGALFLIAWELMALAAFFAATPEDKPEVRRAGWIYLIATHIGTLCLFAMFALWRRATGSFALAPAQGLAPEAAAAIFVLALAGFGFKAGFVPLHFWLPGAHANAPSHVSAVMSGVMLKMGVYGILRMTSLMPLPPLWWGGALLAVGALTGLAGIVLAIGQADIKRVLAYSSVENIGIIAMGMGLALVGSSVGRWELVLLGLAGALLHVWNHGLFKPLLFFGAGAVMNAAGTRDIERLGGLAKRMPALAALFLLGSVAICALPPLNGFASEWLLYLGFFRSLGSGQAATAAAAAVVLAMIGALALACFVRLFSCVFLGSPRSEAGAGAVEPGPGMLAPMIALALGCAALGLLPSMAFPALEAAARDWASAGAAGLGADAGLGLAQAAPFAWIGWTGLALLAACALAFLATRGARLRAARGRPTWDCGYAAPSARMQYSASSFGRSIAGIFAARPKPSRGGPAVRGFFPESLRFEGDAPALALGKALLPAASALDRFLPRLKLLQRGQTPLYLLYVLVITIVLLAFGGLGVPQ
jgi:hydrogenase-4 component B